METNFGSQEDVSSCQKQEHSNFHDEFSFSQMQNQSLVKQNGEIGGSNFLISCNYNCEVHLMDRIGHAIIEKLDQCRVIIGASPGVVSVRNCTNCRFYMACAQLQMFDCNESSIYLFCTEQPQIERSINIEIAPLNQLLYPEQLQHILDSGLDPSNNKWDQVLSETNSSTWHFLQNEPPQIPFDESDDTHFNAETQNKNDSTDVKISNESIIDHIEENDEYDNDFGHNEPQQQPEMFSQSTKNMIQLSKERQNSESKEKQVQNQISVSLNQQSSFNEKDSVNIKYIAQWEKEIQQREDLEKKTIQEMRQIAERQIDEFYDKRTDRKANRQSKNREQQELEQENAEIKLKEIQNPFVYISDLIDLQLTPGSEEVNKDRMRSILIQLKQLDVDGTEEKNNLMNKSKKNELSIFQTSL